MSTRAATRSKKDSFSSNSEETDERDVDEDDLESASDPYGLLDSTISTFT
jgi:hypothetical protein